MIQVIVYSICYGVTIFLIFISENIKVKFFELNEDDSEIWSAYGRFSELDVHHQYAIVFRYFNI